MNLAVPYPLAPMEARVATKLPKEKFFQFEPKWDGFRCLLFRDGPDIELQSKEKKPLTPYFPEMVAAARSLGVRKFVLDGELVIPTENGSPSFNALLHRIHPAPSRVQKLSEITPALFIAFDCLLSRRNESLLSTPLEKRRSALENFAAKWFGKNMHFLLSPCTGDYSAARSWLEKLGTSLDGIIAKKLGTPYCSGSRDCMIKIKFRRTAECVIGGFRWKPGTKQLGSLLLGLYKDSLLYHVGYVNTTREIESLGIPAKLKSSIGTSPFTGSSPGGPSRWNSGRSTEWQAVNATTVVEVEYDHFTDGRFRHGTRFLRYRPDKDAKSCTFAQVEDYGASPLLLAKEALASIRG